MGALAAAASAAIRRFVGPVTAGLTGGAAIPFGAALASGFGIDGGGFGVDGKPRRRRRRRVLTANDRADIAFITATLGAPAGKSFALIVAART